jgi:hypothetical protein
MSGKEMQEKAKYFIKDKGWDYLLIDAYLQTRYFHAWHLREDFNENWNIGIKKISSCKEKIDIGYVSEETEFLIGEIDEIKFKIGGFKKLTSMPDDSLFITTNVALFINEKIVFAIRYTDDCDDAYYANDYSILSVEEFHNNENIEKLLRAFEREKNKREKNNEEKNNKKDNEKYKDKFTF